MGLCDAFILAVNRWAMDLDISWFILTQMFFNFFLEMSPFY